VTVESAISDLNFVERRVLERILAMEGGYVLDFTNRTFQECVLDATGPRPRFANHERQSSRWPKRIAHTCTSAQ
jgi:hypothetical protein